ncbi:hypothetical protein, partial [Clostridium tarantellae]
MCSLLKDSIVDIIDNNNNFFLPKKNVVGLSFGNKSIKNIDTNEPVLRILVKEKVPLNKLYKEDIIPKNFLGIKTDIYQVGNFKRNTTVGSFQIGDFKISIINPFKTTEDNENIKDINFLKSRQRPLQGGLSISPFKDTTAGTLGAIVFDNLTNAPYILSNNHILAFEGKLEKGASIVQPSTFDYNWTSIGNQIATLEKKIHLYYGYAGKNTVNLADAAIAAINPKVKYIKEIYNIGTITGTTKAKLKKSVKKCGKRTGYTTGTITDTNALIIQDMAGGLKSMFKNQILTTLMSEEGDSGSLVLDNSNKVIGLLFGSSPWTSLLSPIDYILKT